MTSRNAGYGVDSFPSCAAMFQILEPWCSDGAPLFRGGPCRRVLTRPFPCRLVWIMVWPFLRNCPVWALLWISVVTWFPLRLAIADLRPTRGQEQDQARVSGECQDRATI